MAFSSKDVLILCLDVGTGMQSSPPGQLSHLQRSIEILSTLIRRKIFSQSKDEVSLVLFGCEETNNNLAEEDNYRNISVTFSLGPANFDMLEYINNGIQPGTVETDFLDAITVSLDILFNETKNKRFKSRRIVLFTNFDHQSSDDNIDGIINGFLNKDMNAELTVIGSSFYVDDKMDAHADNNDGNDDDQPGTSSNMQTLICSPRNARFDEVTGKLKSQNQLAGENMVMKILQSGVAGASYSHADANQAVTGFEKRSVRSAAWKCHLTLGNDLSIPCVAYAKTKEAKLKQSWKKCHANTNKEEDVMPNQYYHKNDDDQTEVVKENVGKGYKYGKDIIPFGAEDEKQMKYTTEEKCLSILGFTSSENISPAIFMDDQAHYVLPEAANSAACLSALIASMQKRHMCAIACYVYRKGSNPKLVALLPHVRPDYKCLVMVALPFCEDVKPLSFNSLMGNSAQKANEEQLSAVDQLIDDLDMSDDDNLLDPKEMLNPFFQFTYQCLHERFLHSRGDLTQPPSPSTIFNLPSGIDKKSAKSLAAISSVFKLKPQSSELPSTKRWKSSDSGQFDHNKKEDDIAESTYQPLATITSTSIENVGTVTPDSDFLSILVNNQNNREMILRAFLQLRERIDDFVNDPFVIKLSVKIIDSLKVLLSKSEQYNEVDCTNRFLLKIKSKLLQSSLQLWDLLIENDINLIGEKEYDGCNRSNFQSVTNPVADQVYEDDTEQDADDLLDMMD